jgi:hypothetical protein
VTSKSHSRSVVAAAAGDAGIAALGIDIEFSDEGRPFADLACFLTGTVPMPMGAGTFYRCWTFAEAYFKAFQKAPEERSIREISTLSQSAERYRLDDGTQILLRRIAERFQLCLVWGSTLQECGLRYIQS